MRDFPADVEYSEWGEGPALLLLPGSFGMGSEWKAVTDRLTRSYHIVTTSLLGYGATAERRPLGNATMRQQTEVIDRILERIGEPAMLSAIRSAASRRLHTQLKARSSRQVSCWWKPTRLAS